MKLVLYTTLALIAFALNSILCRLALRGGEADAAGFTAIRLVSGAIVLTAIVLFSKTTPSSLRQGSWPSAIFLFAYAMCFSLAYLNLTAGTGALILFGSVQLTMIAVTLAGGERPRPLEWLGLVVAAVGLVYLVLPGIESPPLNSSLLMAVAGAAWAMYTLRGRNSIDPTQETAGNFVRTIPLGLIAVGMFWPNVMLTAYGISLAVVSGAITSGIGYAIWYAALKELRSTRAAVVQLAVPVIAAAIGIAFLDEAADVRLIIAGMFILGGIGLVIFGKERSTEIV